MHRRVFGPPLVDAAGFRRVYEGAPPLRVRLLTRMPWLIALHWWHLLPVAVLVVLAVALPRFFPGVAPATRAFATVDGTPVTIDDLAAEARAQGLSPDKVDAVTHQALLKRVIDRRVLALAARKQGIDSDPAFIASRRRSDEMLLASALAQRFVGRDDAVASDAEARTYIAHHPLQFAGRQAIVVDTAVADLGGMPLARLQPAQTFADALDVLQAFGISFERRQQTFDSATLPPDVAAKLANAPIGRPFVLAMGNRSMLGAVVSRTPNPVAPADQMQTARTAAARDAARARVDSAIATLRTQSTIRYLR